MLIVVIKQAVVEKFRGATSVARVLSEVHTQTNRAFAPSAAVKSRLPTTRRNFTSSVAWEAPVQKDTQSIWNFHFCIIVNLSVYNNSKLCFLTKVNFLESCKNSVIYKMNSLCSVVLVTTLIAFAPILTGKTRFFLYHFNWVPEMERQISSGSRSSRRRHLFLRGRLHLDRE